MPRLFVKTDRDNEAGTPAGQIFTFTLLVRVEPAGQGNAFSGAELGLNALTQIFHGSSNLCRHLAFFENGALPAHRDGRGAGQSGQQAVDFYPGEAVFTCLIKPVAQVLTQLRVIGLMHGRLRVGGMR